MADKKIVFFTQRVEIVEAYQERRDCADQRISLFLQKCGYLPVPIPNDVVIVSGMVERLKPNGIVLTGGNSLVKYGGNAPERDKVDHYLLELATVQKIPLYGFCRGMQSILDFFGNELIEVDNHVAVKHYIDGLLPRVEVNSYHRQACKELSNNALDIIMKTDDDVIEMVRHNSFPIMGTMWHPEREKEFSLFDVKNVKSIIGD